MPRLLLFALAVVFAACGDAQPSVPTLTTSDELAERMRARFEEAVGGVPGFTVLVGGYEVAYTVRPASAAPETRVGVRVTPTDSASADPLVQTLVASHVANAAVLAQSVAGQPLTAPVLRDGHRVYAFDAGTAAGLDSLAGTELRVYVDAATFDVREVYRAVRVDSLARPVSMRLLYDDFRTTDGVTLPWRLRVVQEGLDQLLGDEGRMVQGGQLGLARAQLQQQPPSPERNAQLAQVERQLRMVTEGIEEAGVRVRRVTVAPR